ncbi:MAG: APC family permease [Acidobacteriota bacterium]
MSELTAAASRSEPGLHRALRLSDVVLLNVVAIVGLRWLSTAAQMGPASLVLWILALLVFFVPSGLAVMELSTRIPGEGGVYLWAKEAFGDGHGFLAGWTYWVNNLVYFPSLLLFVAGVFLFVGGDAWLGLGDNALYNAGFSLAVLWLALGLNLIGLERGKWVQNLGAIGTWVSAVILVGFGAWVWFHTGSATAFRTAQLIPDLKQLPTLAFFATMTFGFAGLELAPVMGDEIHDPRRTIPRAIVISGVIIAGIYIVGTGVLLVAVPRETISIISGVPQALAAIGERAGVAGIAPVGALLITVGGIGGVGAWAAGTARIPFVVGVDRYLPQGLGRIHPRWGTPHVALLTQGVIASLLLLMAVAGSSVEEAYLVLLDMTIVLYFIPFLYLFAALPVLRARAPDGEEGVLRVPGGAAGVYLAAGLGLMATTLSILLALIPPEGTEGPWLFEIKVVGGCVAFLIAGLAFYLHGKRSQ